MPIKKLKIVEDVLRIDFSQENVVTIGKIRITR